MRRQRSFYDGWRGRQRRRKVRHAVKTRPLWRKVLIFVALLFTFNFPLLSVIWDPPKKR
jgi:hypothetical protein